MIPAELRSREQWVIWRRQKRSGKLTKVPYQARNPAAKASVTNPKTWATYDEAKAAAASNGVAGVGFVFTDDDPFCGIDFDGVVDDGKIEQGTLGLIKQLGTYTEYSPSGNGIHCIGRAEVKGTRHKGNGTEAYDRGRFFCMTGRRFRGAPTRIKQISLTSVMSRIENGAAKSSSEGTSQRSQPKKGQRHPALVALGGELLAAGTPREIVEEVLRAKAGEIKLPQREQDEVGRIVDWLFRQDNVQQRILRDAQTRMVKHQGGLLFQRELHGERKLRDIAFHGDEELAIPDEEVAYVIDQLMPDGTNVLLSAERKLGKTRMALTLVKALVDGSPFLNAFGVDAPAGKVIYINYEMGRIQYRRWLRDLSLQNPERLLVLHAHAGGFPFWLPEVGAEFAAIAHENDAWCIIFDTQLMAMVGYVRSENDNMEVSAWQQEVMKLKTEAEIDNAFILHHIGKADKERGRGASQIEAWPDVLWYMEKEDDGQRSFRSYGRDSELEAIVLGYDRDKQMYTWDGQTRHDDRESAAIRAWLQAMAAAHEVAGVWPKFTVARNLMTGGTNSKRKRLMDKARDQGLVRINEDRAWMLTQTGKDWLAQ